MRCHVSKSSTIPLRGHNLIRYWIKPTAVSKRNYWILQEVLRYNQTTSPFVKGNSFWNTRVTRNSTIKIAATVRCDTLIHKTLLVKRTPYTTFRDATPLSRFHKRFFFFMPKKCIWVLFELFQLCHMYTKRCINVKGYKHAVLTVRC
jgi:hypothetical protein